MEFESRFTCEKIKHRMVVYAKPFYRESYLSGDEFLYQWQDPPCRGMRGVAGTTRPVGEAIKRGSFYLVKTGSLVGFVRPSNAVFHGKVEEQDTFTRITGGFTLPRVTKIWRACLLGLAWGMFLLVCILNASRGPAGNVSLTFGGFITLMVWTVIACVGFRSPLSLQRRQQAEVIDFITKYLLK